MSEREKRESQPVTDESIVIDDSGLREVINEIRARRPGLKTEGEPRFYQTIRELQAKADEEKPTPQE